MATTVRNLIMVSGILILEACADKVELGPVVNPIASLKGSPIEFVIDNSTTRTEYTDRFQIDWTEGDQIHIYSPDVNLSYEADKNGDGVVETINPTRTGPDGVYEVIVPHTTDNLHHNVIQPFGGNESAKLANTLYWSNGRWKKYWDNATNDNSTGYHRFFAAYPAERVVKNGDNTFTHPTLTNPGDNAIYRMQYITNQMNVIDDENTENTGSKLVYNGTPDMKNAYMMAMKEVALEDEDHVLLDFDPIMTTVDIDVTAGGYEVPTGVIVNTRITGVSVIMPKGMANGEIEYNLTAGTTTTKGKLKDESIADWAESVFVGIDHNGEKFIDLAEGETVRLTVFLPPLPTAQTAGTKIKVHAVGPYNYVKTLGSSDLLKQQSRVEVNLPKINPLDETLADKWLSQLSPTIKIKEIALPGYEWVDEDPTAVTEIQAKVSSLLRRGIRVFDFTKIGISSSWGSHTFNKDVITPIKTFLANNNTEFVIIWAGDATLNDFEESVKNIISYEKSLKGKNYSISDLKGKALVLNRGAYDNSSDCYVTEFGHLATTNSERIWQYDRIDVLTSWEQPKSEPSQPRIHYINPGKNKDAYNFITNNTLQTGYPGIIMVPNMGENYSYGDLLVQAIIDCNFKFNLTKSENQ